MYKIKNLTIPKESRILVVSDIHGEIGLFKELLGKVDFASDDYLIINGDMCEKGSNSKDVVRYIMELSCDNRNVHVTEGNCDALVEELINENPRLINYLIQRNSVMKEWLEEVGYVLTEDSSVQEVKDVLMKHYWEEIHWLSNLPTAIETDDFIFVHAGLDDIKNWKDTKRETALSIPAFLNKHHQANKYVVVGHWPVVNYATKIPSDNPIIDKEKKIIAIDGGNVIKPTGQLNALIIEKNKISYTYVDRFPTRTILKDFTADIKMSGSVNYPYYSIIPMEKNEYFTLCKQPDTDQMLYVKNEYIVTTEEGFSVKTDVSCAQISVKAGETMAIVDEECAGYILVKKDGELGWVLREAF